MLILTLTLTHALILNPIPLTLTLGSTALHTLTYFCLVFGRTRFVGTCLVGFLASFCLHLVGVFFLLALRLAEVDAIHDGILDFVI